MLELLDLGFLFSSRLKMTNPNDPADIIAMKMGKLYVDLDERRKTELASELEKIKLFEEEEALRGKNHFKPLYSSCNQCFSVFLIRIERTRRAPTTIQRRAQIGNGCSTTGSGCSTTGQRKRRKGRKTNRCKARRTETKIRF